MNINPLANQKRTYRLLVLLTILSAAILAGWILAQFFLPGQSSPSQPQFHEIDKLSFIKDMEKELLECDLILSFNLPNENRAVRQRQLNIMAQKLASFERRLHRISQSGKLDAPTYLQFRQRSQRLQTQLRFLFAEEMAARDASSAVGKQYQLPISKEEESRMLYLKDCYRRSWERSQSCFKEYYLPRP